MVALYFGLVYYVKHRKGRDGMVPTIFGRYQRNFHNLHETAGILFYGLVFNTIVTGLIYIGTMYDWKR